MRVNSLLIKDLALRIRDCLFTYIACHSVRRAKELFTFNLSEALSSKYIQSSTSNDLWWRLCLHVLPKTMALKEASNLRGKDALQRAWSFLTLFSCMIDLNIGFKDGSGRHCSQWQGSHNMETQEEQHYCFSSCVQSQRRYKKVSQNDQPQRDGPREILWLQL